MKMNWRLFGAIFVFIIFFVLFIFPVHDYKDCAEGYLRECNECHSQNMSYAICSGFCFPPNNNSHGCSVQPNENCEDVITSPYQCATDSYRIRLGVLKLWGEEYYEYNYFDRFYLCSLFQLAVILLSIIVLYVMTNIVYV